MVITSVKTESAPSNRFIAFSQGIIRYEPAMFIIGSKEQWLCRCGLSMNQPYCDGSHKLAKADAPGKLYWYDESGTRHEVRGEFPEIRSF